MGSYIRVFVLGVCVGWAWHKSTVYSIPKEQWNYLAWRERRKAG